VNVEKEHEQPWFPTRTANHDSSGSQHLCYIAESCNAKHADVRAKLKLQKPVHIAEAGAEVSPEAEAAGAADVVAAARVEALRIQFGI
jgi:hypothetical protein